MGFLMLSDGHPSHKAQEAFKNGRLAIVQKSAADLEQADDQDRIPFGKHGKHKVKHLAIQLLSLFPSRILGENRDDAS